ncbi:hypothetical protein C5167_026435 [Papaver somniferum]|uniref:serine/arginine-rich splicing factor RS2Z33-like n=1 Tax=Papaver somniferum TaxID=3469 RepID=UPI000E6FA5AB|nr:serine/arginine-rich splicing factor RS2Z33-like [Papaver somniferum]RZC85766.1 hypothetical protein C5167_026435 [Papaver somniferum]
MSAGKENHTIYIGGLSPKTTQSDIHTAFVCFGTIRFIKIMTDKHTGRPRGYAFLTYDDQSEAEDAIMNMNGMALNGNVLKVNKAHNNMSGSDSGFGNRGYDHGRTCCVCGSRGHFYRECPDLDGDDDCDSSGESSSEAGGCRVGACYNCGELGHFARQCYIGINPTPAEAAAPLRRANNSSKEVVVTAPQFKDSNGGRQCPMPAEAVPPVISVEPISKETSDKVPLQVDSGKMASSEVPPRVASGKKGDPKVPPQVGSEKRTGPAVIGIFSAEDSEDMALKMENTTIIKGFPVPNIYAALYNTIYEKQGHIATKTVIKNSMTALFGLVVDLLVVITEMQESSHLDLTAPLVKHWMSKVSTAEAVKFNVGWLRTTIEEIKNYNIVYFLASTSLYKLSCRTHSSAVIFYLNYVLLFS